VTRIGIYGGSFDPVHRGHLLVAQAAYEELGLSRLFFVPAGQSPFKQGSPPTSGAVRARMLRQALAGKPWSEVDIQELQRDGISYTVETVRNYHSRFPNAELFYLIGADNVGALTQWRAAEELARMAKFVVIPRPGQTEAAMPAPFSGVMLRGWPLSVSSSEIRARVKDGRPVDHLVPKAVAEAIRNNQLYL
jgi:nicotinate-nucleotide adenylyltransferase